MRRRTSVWLAILLMGLGSLAFSATPAQADGRGGGHRGGGHGGGHSQHGNFRPHGGPRHGGWRHHGGHVRYWGPRFLVGVPLGYAGWYAWPRYPAYPAPVVVTPPPPVYVQPDPVSYWYYCQDPAGYYPHVAACPGGWVPVPPQPTP